MFSTITKHYIKCSFAVTTVNATVVKITHGNVTFKNYHVNTSYTDKTIMSKLI
jgi:hypothetical protein